MSARISLVETSANSCEVGMRDVRDLAHGRRLLLQAVLAVQGEGTFQGELPLAKLAMLRGYLSTLGCADVPATRRLLLLALAQLEDEDEAKRLLLPTAILPVLAPTP